ncbi:hypothetical protein I5235_03370 [Neisseria gonorrhoeae]|nr:hypothetical protein [Neisseria gonorrhoeae]
MLKRNLGFDTFKLITIFFLGIRRLQSKHIRAIWDDKSGAIVIRDQNSKDGGTAFRPTLGKTYFDKQK